ncbi:MAG TPA: hypothetical protein VIH76_06990 [Candidatus Acidoferrales bacterium]
MQAPNLQVVGKYPRFIEAPPSDLARDVVSFPPAFPRTRFLKAISTIPDDAPSASDFA